MNIVKSTSKYETWLRHYTPLVQEDLEYKHHLMTTGLFPFMRASFYRWIQVWNETQQDENSSPEVLCVGDIHVENFGTWRDAEGRLVWGINDFDEACILPFSHDVIRLATSAMLAIEHSKMATSGSSAVDAILNGYTEQINRDGKPFVLAEEHDWLRPIALTSLREPVHFWQKMDDLQELNQAAPISAVVALEHMLPERGMAYLVKRRVAGMGSLGHPRMVALAEFRGGRIAREAKALVPSADAWSRGAKGSVEILYQSILDRAIRCRDPLVQMEGQWVVRRLAPDCSRIDLTSLSGGQLEERLLHAMGQELANVHLGTPGAGKRITQNLKKRKKKWYVPILDNMLASIRTDQVAWMQNHHH